MTPTPPGRATTLRALAQLTREINALNCWGEDFHEDLLPINFALNGTEVRELDDELLSGGSVAAQREELADHIIRCLDTAELYRPGALPDVTFVPDDVAGRRVERLLLDLYGEQMDALQAFRKHHADTVILEHLVRGINLAAGMICGLGGDVLDEVHAKLEKNRARGARHGGRRI